MRSFGELLADHIARTGITDAELARTIGVQRQTIFRWKEGLVARPRYREDVLRIATKLRLTPDERDEMLLAAGFPPENPAFVAAVTAVPASGSPPHAISSAHQGSGAAGARGTAMADVGAESSTLTEADGRSIAHTAPSRRLPRQRLVANPGVLLGLSLAVMVAVALIAWAGLRIVLPDRPAPTATPLALNLGVPPATPTERPTPTPTQIVAQPGEKLVLVAPFVGYTADDLRFNVAGRIEEALNKEVRTSSLRDARIEVLPDPLTSQLQARAMLDKSSATAVIWGEYDAGRVRANVVMVGDEQTNWVNPVDSPAGLRLAINERVPEAARMLALYALGRLYRAEGQSELALTMFQKAQDLGPTEPTLSAALHFYVAILLPEVMGTVPAVLTQAIDHYDQVLALQPGWDNARYNRGTAYLGRGLLSMDETADLDAAIADLSAVVARQPTRADPLINRGIAYYQRNGPGDLQAALADLTTAIEIATEDYRGYYHRGLARIRAGEDGWAADLQKTLELKPAYASASNGLCWGYGVAGRPEEALPFCEEAVHGDSTGSSRDSRAITYAQLGRYDEAVTDLKAYLAWVRATYPGLYGKYRGPDVEQWIRSLESGVSPFTPELLVTLRAG